MKTTKIAFECRIEHFFLYEFCFALGTVVHPHTATVRLLSAVNEDIAVFVFDKSYHLRLLRVLVTHDTSASVFRIGHITLPRDARQR